jgi:hypothetical protein
VCDSATSRRGAAAISMEIRSKLGQTPAHATVIKEGEVKLDVSALSFASLESVHSL